MSRNRALEAWEGRVEAFPVADLLDNKWTFFFKNLRVIFYLNFFFGGSGRLKKLKRGKPKSNLGKPFQH